MGTPGYWYTTQLHVPVCILCLCDCKYARMCSLTCKGQKTVSGVSLFDCHVRHASWSSGFQGLSPFCLAFLHRDPWITDAPTSRSTFTHLRDLNLGPCAFQQQVLSSTEPPPQPTAQFLHSNESSFQGLAFNLTSASCPSNTCFPEQVFPLHGHSVPCKPNLPTECSLYRVLFNVHSSL